MRFTITALPSRRLTRTSSSAIGFIFNPNSALPRWPSFAAASIAPRGLSASPSPVRAGCRRATLLGSRFYRLCIEAKAPALVFVGTTGLGAGLPGGAGIILDSCHPRHLDAVAARFADLTIIAARPTWPWQSEMIAVPLHKPDVWRELHGWSPRHFTDESKREIHNPVLARSSCNRSAMRRWTVGNGS